MNPCRKRVAIIGGGVNGIVNLKHCLQENLDAVCFEQHGDIGGIWYYSEKIRDNQGAASFSNLTANTSKETMSFSDFPISSDAPQFLTQRDFHKYIHDYAKEFDLMKHVQLNTTVKRVEPAPKYDTSGQWNVTTLVNNRSETETFDCVIVSTGFLKESYSPHIPGLSGFPGEVLHMKEYRTAEIFKNKRVLIVGNSSSAGDGATEAATVASQVYLSIGRGASLMRRAPIGSRPYDLVPRVLIQLLSKMPHWIRNIAMNEICNKTIHMESYGLGNPPFFPDGAMLVSDILPFQLVCGRVKIKPMLISFEGGMAKFNDGTSEKIDIVMFATGYKSDYSFLSGCEQYPNSQGKQPLHYKWMFPIEHKHHTMCFNGAVRSFGNQPVWIELQARLASKVFSRKHKLPPKDVMLKDVKYRMSLSQGGRIFRVFPADYSNELSEELGCYPSFWHIFFSNPWMAIKVYLTPAISLHYRLLGPDSGDWAWKNSSDAFWRIRAIK